MAPPPHEPPGDSLRLDSDLRAALDRIGHEFQAEFFARALIGRDGDPLLLGELANALTRIGRHEEGLAMDRRVVALVPEDPTAHYNLACSLSLTGRVDEALTTLAHALDLGFCDHDLARTDPDLEAVRTRPEFAALFGGSD